MRICINMRTFTSKAINKYKYKYKFIRVRLKQKSRISPAFLF